MMFPAALIPKPVQPIAAVVKRLAPGLHRAGAEPAPRWVAPLLAEQGARYAVAPELLAAVASVLTGFHPEMPGGIMAVPQALHGDEPVYATVDGLSIAHPDAIAAVRASVTHCALHLGGSGDLVELLTAYVQDSPAVLDHRGAFVHDLVGRILGVFCLYSLRTAAGTPAAQSLLREG